MVATYERVLGRPISVRFVAIGEPVPLPDPMPSLMAGMEAYDSAVEMEEIARTFGVPLTRLETFVREQCYSQPAKETRHRRTSEDFVSAGYGG